jgi:hypothetical protein
MSETCSVCRGAIPGGVEASSHTALCAEVLRADVLRADRENAIAWGIIANAYDGNWSKAPVEWRQAAERWRDEYVTTGRENLKKTRTITRKVSDLIDANEDSPLPLSVIPNHMGINLCSVDSVSWEKRDDDQLVSLTIRFIPE